MRKNFSLTLAFIAGVLAMHRPAAAQTELSQTRHCTDSSLLGDFAFTAHGTTLAALGLPAPLTGAFASSGTAEFDGRGQFTLTAISSFSGVLQGPATVTGTYRVNSDCSYTSQASNGATFRAVIVNQGSEILILQTNSGVVISGTAQSRSARRADTDDDLHRSRACTNRTFSGSYGFLAEGLAGAPAIPSAPFAAIAGVGTVNVNADGTFTMMAQRSVNGILDPEPLPLSGSYTLSQDCKAELTFDVGFHFTAVLVNNDEAVFIESDPGTALIVRSKRI